MNDDTTPLQRCDHCGYGYRGTCICRKVKKNETLEDFLTLRLHELKNAMMLLNFPWEPFSTIIDTQLDLIDMHRNWPVLVEGSTSPETTVYEDFENGNFTYKIRKEFEWMTEQEYIKKFDTSAPTISFLRKLAEAYVDHEDFREEWL